MDLFCIREQVFFCLSVKLKVILPVKYHRFFNRQMFWIIYLLNFRANSTGKLHAQQEFCISMSKIEIPKVERMLTWRIKESGSLVISIILRQEEIGDIPFFVTRKIV